MSGTLSRTVAIRAGPLPICGCAAAFRQIWFGLAETRDGRGDPGAGRLVSPIGMERSKSRDRGDVGAAQPNRALNVTRFLGHLITRETV